ncbi:MAG: diphthamide synthesis protein [Candidatus Pacearchaeota archaeon]
MKYIFIPATSSNSFSFNKIKLAQLPKAVGLVTTIQYIHILPKLKKWLKNQKRQAIIHNDGKILGCNLTNATAIQNKVQAFLYIGSGKFHPLSIALALKKQKPIFIYNPNTNEFSRLNEKEIQAALAKKKTAKIKFLSAKTLGILVSTKPGQQRLKQAEKLKAELENQGKKCYIFIANDIDINQLENFPQIECWINSTCPGLSLEHPFIWIDDV